MLALLRKVKAHQKRAFLALHSKRELLVLYKYIYEKWHFWYDIFYSIWYSVYLSPHAFKPLPFAFLSSVPLSFEKINKTPLQKMCSSFCARLPLVKKKTYIFSHLSYCLTSWSQATGTSIKPQRMSYNRAIKIVKTLSSVVSSNECTDVSGDRPLLFRVS